MGKAKRRSLHLGINDRFSNLTRSEAIEEVVNMLKTGDNDVYGLITLFGLSAEEILEGGASYEAVVSLGNIVN